MSRVLLLTTEPLPVGGLPATGAGLRAWGLARGLRQAGLDVQLLMPARAAATFAPAAAEPKGSGGWPEWVGTFERANIAAALAEHDPDVIVLQHWGLARDLGEPDRPLAIDLAGPHLLERTYWGSTTHEADLEEKLAALRRADFLTASGERQRLYFLPYLALAGWPVAATDVLPVIPFSFEPLMDRPRVRPDRLIYGGFFLPWQDPTRALETALDALDATGRGELLFVGGAHPTFDVSRGQFEALLDRLGRHPRVRLVPAMGFEAYARLLAEGGVALDLLARNPEREIAFTTRTVVYLAAGLPVIHNHYSELGALIARAGAGWALDPDDAEGLGALLRRVLSGEEPIATRAEAALEVVRGELNWERTIEPLARFCRAPAVRADKQAARLAFEERHRHLRRLEGELAETRSRLETLLGKRWVRWGLAATSGDTWLRWPLAVLAGVVGLALIPVFVVNELIGRAFTSRVAREPGEDGGK